MLMTSSVVVSVVVHAHRGSGTFLQAAIAVAGAIMLACPPWLELDWPSCCSPLFDLALLLPPDVVTIVTGPSSPPMTELSRNTCRGDPPRMKRSRAHCVCVQAG